MPLPYPYAPFNPYEIPTQYHHTPLRNIPQISEHFIPPPTQSSISNMPLNYSLSNPTTGIPSRDYIQMPNTLPYNTL